EFQDHPGRGRDGRRGLQEPEIATRHAGNMMFRLIAALRTGKTSPAWRRAALAAPAVLAGLLVADAALADARTDVVPKRIIYPGEEIDAGQVEEVEVTNPNIVKGFAETVADVSGMVSRRTLLPGR